jgi:hypothetical protein
LLTCVVAGVAFFNIYDGLHYRNPRVVDLAIKAAKHLIGKMTPTKLILTFVRFEVEDKALNHLIAHHDCNISIFSIGLKDDQPCIHETGGVQTRTTETVEPREALERLLGLKCCCGIAV